MTDCMAVQRAACPARPRRQLRLQRPHSRIGLQVCSRSELLPFYLTTLSRQHLHRIPVVILLLKSYVSLKELCTVLIRFGPIQTTRCCSSVICAVPLTGCAMRQCFCAWSLAWGRGKLEGCAEVLSALSLVPHDTIKACPCWPDIQHTGERRNAAMPGRPSCRECVWP